MHGRQGVRKETNMSQSKVKNITGWVLQILLGVFFVALSGVPKLMGEAEVAANFERWGYPDWFLMLTGVLELLGAIGLLIPITAGWAASWLRIVMARMQIMDRTW